MALHEQSVGATDEWYTPKYVFHALGCTFDLDVAPALNGNSHVPANNGLGDGLKEPWFGFVWMNPPFGKRNGLVPWLEKFFEHNNGVALVPDRTSAPWWQTYAPRAELTLFVSPKIKFIGVDGKPGQSPAQGTCLFAIGSLARVALQTAAHARLGILMRKV